MNSSSSETGHGTYNRCPRHNPATLCTKSTNSLRHFCSRIADSVSFVENNALFHDADMIRLDNMFMIMLRTFQCTPNKPFDPFFCLFEGPCVIENSSRASPPESACSFVTTWYVVRITSYFFIWSGVMDRPAVP